MTDLGFPTSHPPAATVLAEYALGLRMADVSPEALRAAKLCLVDAVACAIFGAQLPWSRIVAEHAMTTAGDGPCRLPGALERGTALPSAALCLGAFAHAFELDSLRKPGAGVHPGATVALPALMAAQVVGASGEDLLCAIVAGCEVMFRIGKATLHSSEAIGFHAPGITGTFGAATVVGRLLGLNPVQLAHAYGIAGSLSGGLLTFAKSRQGGMIKRLHLGRAAEGGASAALLAQRGYEAPHLILEGKFGVLDAFCDTSDSSLLTKELGTRFETQTLCIKRYACHVTAQSPIELLRFLMEEHRFTGADISSLTLVTSDKVLSHHSERRPHDVMLAQYSVPFCVAIAAFRDPANPNAFASDVLADPNICQLAESIELLPGMPKGWGTRMSLRLRDGRSFEAASDSFVGCPERPMSDLQLKAKFNTLTAVADSASVAELSERLWHIEAVENCSRVFRGLGQRSV